MTAIKLGIPGNVADCFAHYIMNDDRFGVFNKVAAKQDITIIEMLTFGGVITPITEGKGKKKDVGYVVYWIDKPFTSVHWREGNNVSFMGMEEGYHNETKKAALAFFHKYHKEK